MATPRSHTFEPIDDRQLRCGEGKISFQQELNAAVYLDYNTCMDFARAIRNDHRYCSPNEIIPFHVYWHGPIHYQLLQVARSFLATQDLAQSEMWVWSIEPEPVSDPRWTSLVQVAGDKLQWKKYDLVAELPGTPLEGKINHVKRTDDKSWVDSDLFRVIMLHNYGGVYVDADVVLLRDFAPIIGGEWLYQWGSSCNFSNGAVASLHKGSMLSKRLLTKIGEIEPRPGGFDWGRNMYVKVWDTEDRFDRAPCCLFDVHWMYDTTAVHAPHTMSYKGPFAIHIHGLVWKDCIAKNEPLDLLSSWYTERITERLGEIPEFELPRVGSGCNTGKFHEPNQEV